MYGADNALGLTIPVLPPSRGSSQVPQSHFIQGSTEEMGPAPSDLNGE